MNFSDILNKPISIGGGQHLTLKQIVESSFTRANHIDAGLKQAETFFSNLENVIDTVIETATAKTSANAPSFDDFDLSDWKRDPEAAQALVVFEIVTSNYKTTKKPVDDISIVHQILFYKGSKPEIYEMFNINKRLGIEVQKTLSLLVREGMLEHSTMGYHPSSAMAGKTAKQKSPEEEPAVRPADEDILTRVFEDLGIDPQMGSINILDEIRRIESDKMIIPLAGNLAGAAVALYFAAKSNRN